MADQFADLTKSERIEKALTALAKDRTLTAQRAAKIYGVWPSTLTRRLNQFTGPRRAISQS
jgi:DeoR/GlpR family transcriptional regulator of sugar metabolism